MIISVGYTQVLAVSPYKYNISTRATKGGHTITNRIETASEDKFSLEAFCEDDYEFSHWEVEGNCTFVWGNRKDRKVELVLHSYCTATAVFKARGSVFSREDKNQVQNNNTYNSITVHAVSKTPEQIAEEYQFGYRSAGLIAILAAIVAIFLSFSFLYKYGKVFVSVQIKRKKLRKTR